MPRCNACKQEFESAYAVTKHRKQAHPEFYIEQQVASTSPFDRLLDIRKQTKDIMADLEIERTRLQERLIKIDDTLSQYKKGYLPV